MTVATLGLAVVSDPVAKAAADLDKLTAASRGAEAQVKKLTSGTTATANATKQLGAATQAAALQVVAATGAARANAEAIKVVGQQTAMAQMQMRNLAFQFQDIGTMLLAGQAPFMLLAQQLPQVTMYGGQLNGIMGALKQTLAGLFSPLGLLTTGFVLAGSAALSYFRDTEDGSEEAAKVLKDQESLIERVAERWGDTIPALRDYANAIKEAREAADLQSGSQVVMNSYFDEVRRMMPEVNAELSKFAQQAAAGGWGSSMEQEATALAAAYDELHDALQDAADAVQGGEDATEDFKRIQESLTNLLNNEAVGAHDDLAAALADIRDNAGGAVEKLKELQTTLAKGPRLGGETMDEAQERFNFLRQFNMRLNPDEFEDVRRGSRQPRQRRARKTDAERAAERYDDMIRQSQQFIAAQRLEQEAMFMTEEAANALRYEQELLNQAANDNIKLTPEMAAELRNLAADMAATEAETTRLYEAFNFTRDLAKGFFGDVMSGLQQGKSLWESFAQAGLNALQKIADKLLDMAMDQLIQGLFQNILGALGGGFSILPSTAPIPTPRPFAKGGVFDTGISGFSNKVVNQATPFFFAKGAGIMGEAGPEAIMPLKRGPDGKLGVSAANSNHANQNAQPTYNDNRVYKIDARGAQQGVGEEIRRALVEYDREVLPSRVNQIANDPHARG